MTDRLMDKGADDPRDVLGRWVRRTADTVPIVDTDVGLQRIERTVDIRRRRRRVGAPLAAAAVIGAGAFAVVSTAGSSNSTVITPTDSGVVSVPSEVISPSTVTENTTLELIAPTTVDPSVTTAVATTVPVAELPPAQQITTFDVEPITVSAPPGMERLDHGGDVLSFRNGFAATRPTFIGTPGFALTVQEAQILLGLDLAILIEDSGATTQQEAIAAAAEAGFLDEVNAALAQEPQVLDALLNHKWTPGLDVFLSEDGTTWTQTVLELPVERGLITDVASGGDHLVIAVTDDWPGNDGGVRDLDVTIMITSDLETFEVHEWTVPDPTRNLSGPLTSYSQNTQLVASSDGWAFALDPMVDLDTFTILEELVGDDRSSSSTTMSDDRVTFEVQRRDGSGERFEFTWSELGIDSAGVDAIRSARPVTITSAEWGQSPESQTVDVGVGVGTLAPTDTGYLLAANDSVMFVDLQGGSATVDVPAGFEAGGTVATANGAVVALVDEDHRTTFGTVDRISGEWTPIEFDRIGDDELTWFGRGPWPVVVYQRPELEVVPTTATWEQGDFVYSWVRDGSRWSYEVRTLDGDVIVAEEPEPRRDTLPESLFEHLRTGVAGTTVTDPATGEVIIDLTPEETSAMADSATRLDGTPLPVYGEFEPEFWLLAGTLDRWFMHFLGPPVSPDSGGEAGALNGDTILHARGGTWQRFDL